MQNPLFSNKNAQETTNLLQKAFIHLTKSITIYQTTVKLFVLLLSIYISAIIITKKIIVFNSKFSNSIEKNQSLSTSLNTTMSAPTSSQGTKISYIELLSACLSAARQSSSIIVDTLEQGKNQSILNKTDKEYDPQTIADIGAQHIIQSGLRLLYPGIQMIGEEPESSVDNYVKTFNVEAKPILETNLFTTTQEKILPNNDSNSDEKKINQISVEFLPPELAQLDFDHVCIYIDPLDGTSEYTRGHKNHVTTLISITYNGYALAGVLYYPFTGQSLYGGIGLGVYGDKITLIPPTVANQAQIIEKHPKFSVICHKWLTEPQQKESLQVQISPSVLQIPKRRVVTSKSHLTQAIKDYFVKLGLNFDEEVYSAGGAGNKGVHVFTGQATAYLYPSKGTRRWDIGVLDALLFAYGGKLTNLYGEMYQYDGINLSNDDGCVCTINDNHEQYLIPRV